jgi:hypothetical protein
MGSDDLHHYLHGECGFQHGLHPAQPPASRELLRHRVAEGLAARMLSAVCIRKQPGSPQLVSQVAKVYAPA